MSTVRLGLLSTARINEAILAAAAQTDRVEVTAVASRDGARAEAYAAEHGIAGAHGSYESLLRSDDVDAVYISLPNAMHHAWTMRALAAGKHVLCEKPYSRRPDEVEEAWELAAARHLVLTEAFMYRHHPQTAVVHDLVASGAIGRLRQLRAAFGFTLADPGDVRNLPDLEGGSLMDIGCYCVSGARLLAGEPHQVTGMQVRSSTGVDLAFAGVLAFADDVVATFDCSFAVPRRQALEIVGEEGIVRVEAPWRVDAGGDVLLEREGVTERVEVPAGDAYRYQLDDLAAAVRGDGQPRLGLDDALGQARTIEALYRSAAEGRTIAL